MADVAEKNKERNNKLEDSEKGNGKGSQSLAQQNILKY